MFNNIFFIGGVHGVGKSTICRQICNELNLEYLSASELLNWEEIKADSKSKKVDDILDTQNRLLSGLKKTIKKDKHYLLDGHYCLLNSQNEIVNVPFDTFKHINPISLNIIIGDISEIKRRLEARDNKPYEYELLERLQNEERTHAKNLSRTLGITLNQSTQNDHSELLISLRKSLVI